jgi:DNA-binding PadR family transcriptional regulator
VSVKLRPSAKLAVLGLVLQRPSYGYELVARFERVFSEQPWEWRVTAPAIHVTLRDLKPDRLTEPVGFEGATSPQRQSRQNYRVTGEGARSMREWLESPMPGDASREEFLIRLHFGDASDDALRELLRRHAEACLEDLERIGRAPATTRMQRLVKEDRRLAVQARLSWIDAARAELRKPEEGPIRRLDRQRP